MQIIESTIFIFFELIIYIIFFDVVISWLQVLGIKFRPKFLADIIDPTYNFIKKIIPTSFGPIDFTPIVAILLVYIVRAFFIGIFGMV